MTLSAEDWMAFRLTLALATLTVTLLLLIGTPLAWWLARGRSRLHDAVAAVVALPIVLPPTVLGFYLLVALGPHGPIGQLTESLGLGLLPFTFAGLVVASTVYSLPFVVHPIRDAFRAIGASPFETAATLRAGPWDRFVHIALPLARPGLLTGAILGFAHTLGEFGIVLMIGGNLPGRTQVLSMQIYNHVEALEYRQAHGLAFLLLLVSFVGLLLAQRYGQGRRTGL